MQRIILLLKNQRKPKLLSWVKVQSSRFEIERRFGQSFNVVLVLETLQTKRESDLYLRSKSGVVIDTIFLTSIFKYSKSYLGEQ